MDFKSNQRIASSFFLKRRRPHKRRGLALKEPRIVWRLGLILLGHCINLFMVIMLEARARRLSEQQHRRICWVEDNWEESESLPWHIKRRRPSSLAHRLYLSNLTPVNLKLCFMPFSCGITGYKLKHWGVYLPAQPPFQLTVPFKTSTEIFLADWMSLWAISVEKVMQLSYFMFPAIKNTFREQYDEMNLIEQCEPMPTMVEETRNSSAQENNGEASPFGTKKIKELFSAPELTLVKQTIYSDVQLNKTNVSSFGANVGKGKHETVMLAPTLIWVLRILFAFKYAVRCEVKYDIRCRYMKSRNQVTYFVHEKAQLMVGIISRKIMKTVPSKNKTDLLVNNPHWGYPFSSYSCHGNRIMNASVEPMNNWPWIIIIELQLKRTTCRIIKSVGCDFLILRWRVTNETNVKERNLRSAENLRLYCEDSCIPILYVVTDQLKRFWKENEISHLLFDMLCTGPNAVSNNIKDMYRQLNYWFRSKCVNISSINVFTSFLREYHYSKLNNEMKTFPTITAVNCIISKFHLHQVMRFRFFDCSNFLTGSVFWQPVMTFRTIDCITLLGKSVNYAENQRNNQRKRSKKHRSSRQMNNAEPLKEQESFLRSHRKKHTNYLSKVKPCTTFLVKKCKVGES